MEENILSAGDLQFADLGLCADLLRTLEHIKFVIPTDIQKMAIPLILAGRDVLATAQTGTGKTAAFALPILSRLSQRSEGSLAQGGALILTPTRELAAQVHKAFERFLGRNPFMETALLIGGEHYDRQFRQLKKNPCIIVGTPGRVNDHLLRKSLNLDHIKYLVLDETDRMLDMGFGIQIEKILKFIPQGRQTLLFSATLPKEILSLAQRYLSDAERILCGAPNQPIESIKQEVINVSEEEKYEELKRQLTARDGSIIIFVKTRRDAENVARRLTKDSHVALAIHGNLQQRQRSRVIQNFREKKCRILVATDVAARGLDIPHIEHVINYDLPQCPEDYVHRIGRTARAGASGSALCLLAPLDRRKWYAIERLINPGKHPGGSEKRFPSERPAYRGGYRNSDSRQRFSREGGPRRFGSSFSPSGDRPFRPFDDHKSQYGVRRHTPDAPRGERRDFGGSGSAGNYGRRSGGEGFGGGNPHFPDGRRQRNFGGDESRHNDYGPRQSWRARA